MPTKTLKQPWTGSSEVGTQQGDEEHLDAGAFHGGKQTQGTKLEELIYAS